MWTLPKEVVIKAIECCHDIYPHEDDVLINDRSPEVLSINALKEVSDLEFKI